MDEAGRVALGRHAKRYDRRRPKGINQEGEVRDQFHHVIDVGPTIRQAACFPEPYMVNSVGQVPMQGVSIADSFDDAKAAECHETQYFEMSGIRGIFHKGWMGGHASSNTADHDGGNATFRRRCVGSDHTTKDSVVVGRPFEETPDRAP